jgi:hypothetical protein
VQILQFLIIPVLHKKVSEKKTLHLVAKMDVPVGSDPRFPDVASIQSHRLRVVWKLKSC